jgi:DegV family protein with EDD domain
MKNVAVVTDSVASIPENLLKKYHIHTVAYYIHRGEEVFRDLLTIQREEFFDWMKSADELPKTASPGPGDYLEMYEDIAKQGIDEILSIHMTSKGSGAFQAAKASLPILKEKLPNIRVEVIDTLNVSMCQGWIALEAARASMQGRSINDILQLINELILKVQMIQTADTLKYLYLGGRIGRAKHLVGTLLNIKPLISMKGGVIVALGQARSRSKAYQMIAELIHNAVGDKKIKAAYMHAAAKEEIEMLRIEISNRIQVVEDFIAELSPALGVHTGPGTAGVCYYPVN